MCSIILSKEVKYGKEVRHTVFEPVLFTVQTRVRRKFNRDKTSGAWFTRDALDLPTLRQKFWGGVCGCFKLRAERRGNDDPFGGSVRSGADFGGRGAGCTQVYKEPGRTLAGLPAQNEKVERGLPQFWVCRLYLVSSI